MMLSIYRHTLVVRLTHWIRAACLVVMLMSGLQIFNAHPALYWGQKSDFDRPLLAMTASENSSGQAVGTTTVFGRSFDTTGLLGVSASPGGGLDQRGFPAWITLPSWGDLAAGRRLHFFFGWLFVFNGLVYYLHTFASGHWRDLAPSRRQLGHIGQSILDHLRLRFRHDAGYNVLQKLTYIAVIFGLLPLMVMTGLAMSPGFDAVVPQLLVLCGGRQSARTLHFIAAWSIVAFVVVHIAMVLLSGAWNNLRSMITGRYVTGGSSDDRVA